MSTDTGASFVVRLRSAILADRMPYVDVEPSFTTEELRSVHAPALLVVGDQDLVTPEHAVEMFRTIPTLLHG
jgi:pimeloyl-ACP methyl ester carboxylesterase